MFMLHRDNHCYKKKENKGDSWSWGYRDLLSRLGERNKTRHNNNARRRYYYYRTLSHKHTNNLHLVTIQVRPFSEPPQDN